MSVRVRFMVIMVIIASMSISIGYSSQSDEEGRLREVEGALVPSSCGNAGVTADDTDAYTGVGVYSSTSPSGSYGQTNCSGNYVYDLTNTNGRDVAPDASVAWVGSVPSTQSDCNNAGWEIRLFGDAGAGWVNEGQKSNNGTWSGGVCSFSGNTWSAYINTAYNKFRMAGNAFDINGSRQIKLEFGVRDDP